MFQFFSNCILYLRIFHLISFITFTCSATAFFLMWRFSNIWIPLRSNCCWRFHWLMLFALFNGCLTQTHARFVRCARQIEREKERGTPITRNVCCIVCYSRESKVNVVRVLFSYKNLFLPSTLFLFLRLIRFNTKPTALVSIGIYTQLHIHFFPRLSVPCAIQPFTPSTLGNSKLEWCVLNIQKIE